MQNKGHGKAAKVVNFVAKWLNLCLSTVVISQEIFIVRASVPSLINRDYFFGILVKPHYN